jgi:hypothetical protein
MRYMPRVESMNRIGAAPLGDKHTALMFDHIISAGVVQYAYLLAVFENPNWEPVYFVASEIDQMAGAFPEVDHTAWRQAMGTQRQFGSFINRQYCVAFCGERSCGVRLLHA